MYLHHRHQITSLLSVSQHYHVHYYLFKDETTPRQHDQTEIVVPMQASQICLLVIQMSASLTFKIQKKTQHLPSSIKISVYL